MSPPPHKFVATTFSRLENVFIIDTKGTHSFARLEYISIPYATFPIGKKQAFNHTLLFPFKINNIITLLDNLYSTLYAVKW